MKICISKRSRKYSYPNRYAIYTFPYGSANEELVIRTTRKHISTSNATYKIIKDLWWGYV